MPVQPDVLALPEASLSGYFLEGGVIVQAGTPDDIADMAVALLCDRFSRYVAGTTVAVDGGLSPFN